MPDLSTHPSDNLLIHFLLGKLPHYTRKARHLHLLLRHSGPRKLANVLSAEWALRSGRTYLSSMPYIYMCDGTTTFTAK